MTNDGGSSWKTVFSDTGNFYVRRLPMLFGHVRERPGLFLLCVSSLTRLTANPATLSGVALLVRLTATPPLLVLAFTARRMVVRHGTAHSTHLARHLLVTA